MAGSLAGKRVAFLMANEGVEQVELTEPWRAVQSESGTPMLVAPEAGKVRAWKHFDKADEFEVNTTIEDATAADFDALVLPGGVANPDQLRTLPAAVRFVREFVDAGKPIAVICHGPWTLIDAGAVRDRTMTSWPSLRTDLTNAGAEWVDEPVVVDDRGPGVIVSSRKPADLPAFCERMVAAIAHASAHDMRHAS